MATLSQRLLFAAAFQPLQRSLALGEPDPLGDLQADIDQVFEMAADVQARLSKYTTNLSMDTVSAGRAQREMAAWANDYGLDALSMNPDAPMPDGMQPKLPQDQARNFVVSVYFDGIRGLGLYQSGAMRQAVMNGEWTVAEVRADLIARRQAFQLLTGMDEEGDLARIFAPTNLAGLGALPAWAVVAIVVCLAALVGGLAYTYLSGKTARSEFWERFDAMCKKAQETGDKKTTEKCLDTVSKIPEPADPVTNALYIMGGVGLVFLIVNFTVPKLLEQRASRALP